MSAAITVEGLSKAYFLGSIGTGSLAEDISKWWAGVRGLPDPTRVVGGGLPQRLSGDTFWALRDVSFEIKKGDVVGLIGRNGAGKSTLLKILSRITGPTRGRIEIHGRIASLLEVGTGFHLELTGRENIFLNGAILGMSKTEIRQKFDEIVAFSECETFLDTPVKRYSSGMYVRLAFAVAAHLEPEILILDEVLAVGDAAFQRKCLGKIKDVSGHGRTVLFVSHSMASVASLCTRAILMQDGQVALDSDVQSGIRAYQAIPVVGQDESIDLRAASRKGNGKARFESLRISAADPGGGPLEFAVTGCDLTFEVGLRCHEDFDDNNVMVSVCDTSGYRLIDASTGAQGRLVSLRRGQDATIRFTMNQVLLRPGNYTIALWMGRGGVEPTDHVEAAGQLLIEEVVGGRDFVTAATGPYQCTFRFDMSETMAGAAR